MGILLIVAIIMACFIVFCAVSEYKPCWQVYPPGDSSL